MDQPPRRVRIDSLDRFRGLVMMLMALDHSRALYGALGDPTDLATTTPALFVTRWLTHLCAPGFVALAGLGAALYARRVGGDRASRFLITRGLWLIFLEVAVVNTCWQLGIPSLSLLVIWALGASMLCLGLLVRLGRPAPLAFGAVVVLGHNLLGGVTPADVGAFAIPWSLAMAPDSWEVAGFPIAVSYPFLPWAGVMALGWAVAPWLVGQGGVRMRRAAALGAGLVAAFVLLRGLSLYGDPRPWSPQERGQLFTLFSVLDTTKYPPSLQYLLMTLGPALLLLPVLDRLRGPARQSLLVYGRVPLFFYLLHIPLLQVGSQGIRVIKGGPDAPLEPDLLRVYAGWAVTLALLYPLCQAWGRLKVRRRDWWWLRYL